MQATDKRTARIGDYVLHGTQPTFPGDARNAWRVVGSYATHIKVACGMRTAKWPLGTFTVLRGSDEA